MEELNVEELRDVLNAFGKVLKNLLPENYGFTLLTYPHDKTESRLYYVSNSNREDVVRVMEEFIEKTETTWGKHDGLED